jgi:hypothetical protein
LVDARRSRPALTGPCRRDPDWQARIVGLQGQLDTDGHARAFALALELRKTLTGKT